MLHLVIGGSGSGKSEFAENICVRLAAEAGGMEKLYIATMEPFGEEGAKRIARHHKLRKGKGFDTLECYTHLEDADIPKGCIALLECMSNLVANEIFSPNGRGGQVFSDRTDTAIRDMADAIHQGVTHLMAEAIHVVIVTNDVFSDGITYDPDTQNYIKVLGAVNGKLAARADAVTEVVCGIPLQLK